MSTRVAARLAWSVCGLILTLMACGLVLTFLNHGGVPEVSDHLALTMSAVVGGLIASRRPENPVGWFFLGSAGCLVLAGIAYEYATYGLPAAWVMAWLLSWVWLPGVMLLLCFVPLYFPDGRLVSRRWRWAVGLALWFSATGAVLSALSPGEIQNERIVNPLGVDPLQRVLDILAPVYGVLYFILLFASAASLLVRYRRSGSVERQQIKWLAFAALAIPLWFLTNAPIEAAAPGLFSVVDSLAFTMIPVAIGIA